MPFCTVMCCSLQTSRYKKQFKIKLRVPINNIWLAKNTVEHGDSSELKSLKLGWPLQNFTAKFSSVELKDKWHRFLERSITQSQKMDGLQNTLVKITTSNINNSSSSAILAAHNLDTIRDVINMALPGLGLTGSERDYQLWVHYGKTEAPFPLMGHENPYTIQEHYYRTSISQSAPGKPTSPHILLESIPEILADGKLQFILTCRGKPRPQRRGAFFRNYLSCLGATASQDGLSLDTDATAQLVRLQMNDLTAVILEMLHFLRQNGPSTKGIFQNIDNIKSFLCLKERIMFGHTLNWENESPLVVAAASKDCLRIIPGTLFTMELYDSWLGVLDEDEVEIAEIRRLLEHLPACNVDILRQLCLCLHEISNYASFNLMSAPKLAFYITTSVFSLWKCTSQIASLENEIVKQMSIIEILLKTTHRSLNTTMSLYLVRDAEIPAPAVETALNMKSSCGIQKMAQNTCQDIEPDSLEVEPPKGMEKELKEELITSHKASAPCAPELEQDAQGM
ncbi:rho GTPase-activating protein 20-like, partial [Ochotona princeps]|uniref:rho GTPase-activating protein 20-like n=1 Tax=Ochotona princeps TaxID=9978 RepID=UPI00271504BA